jgi:hypothetical protein
MYINKCVVCGKEFEAKVLHKVTCSIECRKIHQSNKSYNFYKNKKENGFEKVCETCGSIFTSEREESKYCSRQCNRSGSLFKKVRDQSLETVLKRIKTHTEFPLHPTLLSFYVFIVRSIDVITSISQNNCSNFCQVS